MRSLRMAVALVLGIVSLAFLAALALAAGYEAQAERLEEQRRDLAAPALGVEVGEGGVTHGRQAAHGSHSARPAGVFA
jgi:hypothetical protein